METKEDLQIIALMDYFDYREYLKDYIAYRRRIGDSITNRSFASAVGISSSSWLTTVLNGKKGITPRTVNAISCYLKHNEWERDYFKMLVDFDQAKTIDKRNQCFSVLKQHLLKRGLYFVRILDAEKYEYYSKWYYTAVRSIMGMISLGDEYERIARLVSPAISINQAKKSVELLKGLGLIVKNDQGFYELKNKAITTGTNVRSLSIANFQRETMRLGSEAIDRYEHSVRNITSLSIGISEENYRKIVAMLAELRKTIVDLANNDQNADRVYQVNFQIFPLSKVLSDNKELHNEN